MRTCALCRKRFRNKHSHYKDHSYVTSGEFSLDPIKDNSLLEQDEENGGGSVFVCLYSFLTTYAVVLKRKSIHLCAYTHEYMHMYMYMYIYIHVCDACTCIHGQLSYYTEQNGVSPTHSGLSNGYHHSASSSRSPRSQRRYGNHSNSPR